jgi:hypothetical protein
MFLRGHHPGIPRRQYAICGGACLTGELWRGLYSSRWR